MHELIEQLKKKQLLWQGNEVSSQQASRSAVSSGFEVLDEKLAGGLPANGVIELQSLGGIGELRLLFPHLRAADDGRLIAFIQPPANLNAETLLAERIDTNRILLVESQTTQHAFWAAEQCLRSGACSHVMLWCDDVEIHQARRFQVGCETGNCRHILFRSAQTRLFSLPISLAMHLTPHDVGLQVQITKYKGQWEPKPFLLNMHPFWPQLTHHQPQHKVVSFPSRKLG